MLAKWFNNVRIVRMSDLPSISSPVSMSDQHGTAGSQDPANLEPSISPNKHRPVSPSIPALEKLSLDTIGSHLEPPKVEHSHRLDLFLRAKSAHQVCDPHTRTILAGDAVAPANNLKPPDTPTSTAPPMGNSKPSDGFSRKCPISGDEEGEGDDTDRQRGPCLKTPADAQPPLMLACPYLKRNSGRYRTHASCAKSWWKEARRVK